MTPAQKLATQLLSYIADIPEERWCVEMYRGPEGTCCFYGHLGVGETVAWGTQSKIDRALHLNLAAVNNGDDVHYPQPVIKERVVNALCDIIEGEAGAGCTSAPASINASVTP